MPSMVVAVVGLPPVRLALREFAFGEEMLKDVMGRASVELVGAIGEINLRGLLQG